MPGMYLAQLWKDDKVLSKGRLVVPKGENPVGYVQGLADSMLDTGSERKKQDEMAAEAPPPMADNEVSLEPPPEGAEEPPKTPGQKQNPPKDEDEELNLDDLDIDLTNL